MRTVLIGNPAAGRGRVARRWDAHVASVRAALGDVEVLATERRGHAVELARDVAAAGADRVLSLGGDGTHHEVVNGLMAAGRDPGEVSFGALPAGTGGDFCRLYPVERTVDAIARHIADGGTTALDVGLVRFTDDAGRPARRWFLNICSTGVGGLVDRYVAAARARVGGRLAYFGATLRAQFAYQPALLRISVDGDDVGVFETQSLAVCNGQWFGGGMHVAPTARPDDGQLEVVLIPALDLPRTLTVARTLYRGTHVDLPYVRTWQGRAIDVAVETGTAWMDIDGEPPGVAPCRIELERGALRLLGEVRP